MDQQALFGKLRDFSSGNCTKVIKKHSLIPGPSTPPGAIPSPAGRRKKNSALSRGMSHGVPPSPSGMGGGEGGF